MPKLQALIILSLEFCIFFLSCSKEVQSEISTEKVPITSSSKEALADFRQGMILSDKLQRIQARSYFLSALEKDPEFATAWLSLGMVSPGLNELITALDSAKAYMGHVSEAEQLNIKAVEYGLLGMNIEQADALEKIVEMYPGDERAHINLGNYLYGNQQYQEAIQSYSQAISINDELAAPYNMLGYSQRALGNYGEAEKAFKRYIKLNTQNPNAFDSYAELLLEMGRYNESIEYYQKALALDSSFVASYIGIASNYNFLGEPELARAALQNIRDVASNHIILRQAKFAKAVSYVCEGKFDDAVHEIEENLRIARDNQDAANMANDRILLGNIYLELGEGEKALEQYQLAMETIDRSDLQMGIKDFAHTIDLFNTSRAHAALGDFRLAKEEAESFNDIVSALKNPVQIGLSHQLFGIIALHEKKYKPAIDHLEMANQLNPNNLYRIGLAYEGMGDEKMASQMFQRARELNILNNMDQALVLWKCEDRKSTQNL